MKKFNLFAVFNAVCFLFLTTGTPAYPEENNDEKVLTKRVVVNAKRLPEEGADEDKVSVNATIITRDEIDSSSARTVQQLLMEQAGVIFFDNVGNGVQTTIGLRGFSDGRALAVYVDGVRVNEPFNNSTNFEFIDLNIIERIEIIPGAASASRGSGATAGTVNIITRRGDRRAWNVVTGEYGSFDTYSGSVQSGSAIGNHDYFISLGSGNSEGFRDNADLEERNVFAKYSWRSQTGDSAEVSYRYFTGDYGNSGALLATELEENREQNPFNAVDFTNSDENVLTGRFDRMISDTLRISVLGFFRDSMIEVLTTGRSAALYGGFHSTNDSQSKGITAEISYSGQAADLNPSFVAGLEYSLDEFSNIGNYTDAVGDATFDANDRETDRTNIGLYAEGSLAVFKALTLSGSLRYDSVEMDFNDNFDSSNSTTEFSETTGAIGATYKLNPGSSLFFRYSQSFQTPTVDDLFAFPFYGSNPDLKPVTGDAFEGGVRFSLEDKYFIQAALYWMDLNNEIVFIILDPASFFGENQNVGESRRTGFETALYGQVNDNLFLRAGYAYAKAENISQAEENDVDELLLPMVPEHKFTALAKYSLDSTYLTWTLVYVGNQVMESDNNNLGERLDSYLLNNMTIGWDQRAWGLRLDIRNIFDKEYSTRAIYSSGTSYFTPAAGMNAQASVIFRY